MSDRKLAWTPEAWDHYLYWQPHDREALRRINQLITDILRGDPFEGIGEPDPLKHALTRAWSRRFDEENRLVYLASDTQVTILQARYHY